MTTLAAPSATFRLERYVSDGDEESGRHCEMVIVDYEGATLHPRSVHIADIFFNGFEWLLLKYTEFETDDDGNVKPNLIDGPIPDGVHLNVNPERYVDLRALTNATNQDRHQREQAIQASLDAQLKFERTRYRDDTLEDALLLGTALARVYWRAVSADM